MFFCKAPRVTITQAAQNYIYHYNELVTQIIVWRTSYDEQHSGAKNCHIPKHYIGLLADGWSTRSTLAQNQ